MLTEYRSRSQPWETDMNKWSFAVGITKISFTLSPLYCYIDHWFRVIIVINPKTKNDSAMFLMIFFGSLNETQLFDNLILAFFHAICHESWFPHKHTQYALMRASSNFIHTMKSDPGQPRERGTSRKKTRKSKGHRGAVIGTVGDCNRKGKRLLLECRSMGRYN